MKKLKNKPSNPVKDTAVQTWYVGLQCTSYGTVTRERNPKDRWTGQDTVTHWDVRGIKVSDKGGYELLPIDINSGSVVYVVYAIWSTGDSFGHSRDSSCEAFGVFPSRKQAMEYEQQLRDGTSKLNYVPWNGYFESLTGIYIQSGIV